MAMKNSPEKINRLKVIFSNKPRQRHADCRKNTLATLVAVSIYAAATRKMVSRCAVHLSEQKPARKAAPPCRQDATKSRFAGCPEPPIKALTKPETGRYESHRAYT